MKTPVHYIVSTVYDDHAVCGVSYVMRADDIKIGNVHARMGDNGVDFDLFSNDPTETDCPYCKATTTWKQAILQHTLQGKNK